MPEAPKSRLIGRGQEVRVVVEAPHHESADAVVIPVVDGLGPPAHTAGLLPDAGTMKIEDNAVQPKVYHAREVGHTHLRQAIHDPNSLSGSNRQRRRRVQILVHHHIRLRQKLKCRFHVRHLHLLVFQCLHPDHLNGLERGLRLHRRPFPQAILQAIKICRFRLLRRRQNFLIRLPAGLRTLMRHLDRTATTLAGVRVAVFRGIYVAASGVDSAQRRLLQADPEQTL